MKKILLYPLSLALLLGYSAFAQTATIKNQSSKISNENWLQMKKTTGNFYDIQKAFYSDPDNSAVRSGDDGDNEEKDNAGWELFKSWEYFASPRVYPSGDLSLLAQTHANYQNYLSTHSLAPTSSESTLSTNTWSYLGPVSEPSNGGVGRINCVTVDPTNSSNLWIGAPDGGIWKSTNGGTSWSTNTDAFTDLGISDIAIDATNTQIMFAATGDRDGYYSGSAHTASFGIMKSTDGGTTWTSVYSLSVSSGAIISRILIDPSNDQNIYAAGSFGIIKSTNGGTSWSSVYSGGDVIFSMEFKPGTSSTIYATGTQFHLSTNSGTSWTTVTSGLPSSSAVIRMAVAVTAANPAYVYVAAASGSNYSLYGVYQSTNSGTSFTIEHSTSQSPYLLGFNQNGSDANTGQGFYTLSIAASPTNASEIMVGGVNIWKSTDGGSTWGSNAVTYWAASHTAADYTHADIHDLLYLNGTTVFTGCDGGIFKTTNDGTNWTDLSNDIQIGQMYGLGMSTTNANKTLSGWQDNGTNLMTSTSSWNETLSGDGMKCFIDWSTDNTMYGEQYDGSFNRSTNSGASWTYLGAPASESTAWATPWKQDPNTANTIYGGMTNLYKSTNQGTSWSKIGTQPNSSYYINEFAIAPSNSNVIYVVKNSGVYVTTNGGTSWSTVNSGLPTSSAAATYVAVCPTNSNIAYVTFSGFSSGNKVYVTTNGGTSWTNYSTGLPNLPADCITYQKNAHGAVYVGMDVGVYYRDSTLSSWQPYNTGLPNAIVTQMEIYYPTGMLRASTFGRGMWQIPVNSPGNNPPTADFVGTPTTICPGTTVNFTDLSGFSPTSWSWSFPGGTPATSTAQNPSVVYNTSGSYNVSLTATNSNGSNSITKTAYINVSGPQALPLVEGFEGATFPPTYWGLNPYPYEWAHNTTVGHNSSQCAEFDNADTNSIGTLSYMLTPKYDFSSVATAKLFFDVAYAPYDKYYSDTLAVYVSKDCGLTFTKVYSKGGLTLGTFGGYDSTSIDVPTNAQWRTDTVSLNAYAGQSSILVKFENRPGYGQVLYLDNVNIAGVNVAGPPTASYSTTSSPVCKGSSITYTSTSTGSPTSYSWTFQSGTPATSTSASQVVTYSTAGTYTVSLKVTNSSGSNTTTSSITVNPTPTVSASASASTVCAGTSTTITGSGGSTYSWSTGGTSASISVSPTSTKTYTVTGTNSSGCTNTATITITVNPIPTVSASAGATSICAGSSTTLTGSGGSTYSWSTGGTSASISVSPTSTKTYTVTGTSGSGCTNTATITITVNPMPTVSVSAGTTSICAGSNTTLTGSGASTYSWSNGSTGSPITVNPGATKTFTVTGTSGSGCTNTATVTITVNPTPTVSVSAGTTSICAGSSTTLTGSGASSYSWSNGSTGTTVTVTPSTTKTYTVTGTNGSGCTNTATVTITVNPIPTVNASASLTTICSGNTTTLTGSGGSTYSWSTGATNASTSVSPTTTTTYTVTATNGSGCSNSATIQITVASSLAVTASASAPTICDGSSTTITASGGTTYSWSTGATSASTSVSPTTTTTYTVTGTSSGGCSGTSTVTVTVNPNPATPTVTETGGTLTANPPASAYQWYLNGSPIAGATSQTYTPVSNGNYTVEETNSSGCSTTSATDSVIDTGVNEINFSNSFNVYPNPNNGEFELNFTVNNMDNYMIEIHNAIGQLVYREYLSNYTGTYSKQINLQNFGKGIYMLSLTNSHNQGIKKLIVF